MTRVFVNGTFDILHVGHVELLRYAKSLGDRLIVGVDSDDRVKQLKGPNRPINREYERFHMLSALKPVDAVIIFDTDEDLISLIEDCDIMVKGSDYKGKHIVGEEVCKKLVFFERIDGYSTTEKIQYIANR
jgi:D-beta-D-heptose 7-phosphate kinase/D-beta-D-heptose 1-phosphate adenosyltransferase